MVAVRLPEEIEARLAHIAQLTGRTKTFYVREAILQHLDDLEDIYLAKQVLEDIASGKEKTHSLDEVEQLLGL